MWYIYRPDALTVWDNPEVKKRLNWYYRVMRNEKPAKYLICKRIPTQINLKEASLKQLWQEHETLAEKFKKTWNKIKQNKLKLVDLPKPKQNFLDLKIEIAKRMSR